MNHKKSIVSEVLGAINNLRIPLEESYYDCDNPSKYLDNEHFHHSLKGCEVEMRRTSNVQRDNRISINRYCKTHNCLCSKTGWELGWFSGTNNKIYDNRNVKKKCQNCNEWFMAKSGNIKYCHTCAVIVGREKSREHYANKISNKINNNVNNNVNNLLIKS